MNTYFSMKVVQKKQGKDGENLRATDDLGRYALWEHTLDYVEMMNNFKKYVPKNKWLIDDDE